MMEAPMELFDVVSAAVPLLLLNTPAAIYAQQEQQDLANLRQQEDPEPTEQEKPARPQDARQDDASKPGDRKAFTAPQRKNRERALRTNL
jgi:hypothetical protein